MDDSFVQWLLLAGPLWAAIGIYFLPRMVPKRKRDSAISESSLQVAGVVGGFALGPLGIGLFYLEPRLIRRLTLVAGILSLIHI